MAPNSRSCRPTAPLVLLFLLAVSSTAISYPLHHRDVNNGRDVVDAVQAPSILHTNADADREQEQEPLINQDVPPRRYVRLDDVTEALDEMEAVVVPAYAVDWEVVEADQGAGEGTRGVVADVVRVVVEELEGWKARLGRKIWGLGEGEGNVIGGRQADL